MKYRLQDLIDTEQFQNLQDRLNEIYSFPSAIIDNEGNILTSSAWQDVCTQFHRKHPDCERECRLSDQYILSHIHEANPAVSYRCPRGLVDNATPIVIDGVHYGNFFTGQFFLEKPDMNFFKAQAKKYGFEEDDYLKAVEKVPVWTQEKLNSYLFLIKGLIEVIFQNGMKSLKEGEVKRQISESNQFNRQVIDSAHEGIIVYGTDLRYQVWNPFMEVLTGIKAREVMGKHPWEIFPFLKDRGVIERLKLALTGVRPDPVEFPFDINGKSGWTRDTSAPLRNATGEIIGVIATVQNVTDYKQSAVKLTHFHNLMRYVIEHNRSAIAVHDRNMRYVYVSQRYLEDYKVKEQDVIGKQHYEVFPDLPQKWRDVHQKALGGEVLSAEDDPYVRDDGSVEWTRWECRPWNEADGSIGGIIIYTEVITERKRAEEDLRRKTAILEAQLNSTDDGILIVDSQGKKVIQNRRAVELWKIPKHIADGNDDEAQVKHIMHMTKHPEQFVEQIAHLYGHPQEISRDEIELTDGTVFERYSAPVLGKDGHNYGRIWSFHDITERKRADEALRESEEKFRVLFEQAGEHILILDPTSPNGPVIIDANQSACQRHGFTLEELVGRPIADIDDEENKLHVAERSERIKAGEHLIFETVHCRKDGTTFPVEVSAKLVERTGKSPLIFTVERDITERKQSTEALRKTHEQLILAQRSAGAGVWDWDMATDKLEWSTELFGLFGLDPSVDKSDFETWRRVIHAEDRDMAAEGIQVAIRDHARLDNEYRIVLPTGETRTINALGHTVYDAEGRPVRMTGICLDVTERKRTEETLRKERTLLRTIIDNIPYPIYAKDAHARKIVANIADVHNIGANSESDVLGMDDFDLFPKEEAEKYFAVDSAVLKSGEPILDIEDAFKKESGETIWLLSSKIPFFDDEGKVAGLVGIGKDITERVKAAEEIRKLSMAVEQSPASIIITDLTGAIEYVNRKFTRLTGYTLEEVRGQNPRVLKGEKTSSEEYRKLWNVLLGGGEWHGEFHNRKKNGEFYWESASISPVIDSAGRITHFLAVKEDITERKQLEEKLQQAQKMEAIGQLAGGVAHDFNNILAAILMHLGILREDLNLANEVRDSLKELESQARRAANLTRQLLMFSRRSVLEIRVLDLNDVIAVVLTMLHRLIGEHIKLVFESEANLPPVEADAGMMDQVLMNLVVNARDAMPKGGRITIATGVYVFDTVHAKMRSDVQPGQFVRISVTDTGCGMDKATLGRIFEPFFTTKEPGKGTGMGLATIYGIVAQHKGWVEVDSEVGKGTEFRVFMPVSTRKLDAPTESLKHAVVGGSETILLVEDEDNVRLLLANGFRLRGYRVLLAFNGPEALKLWKTHGDTIDLLFTDMVMPEGMSGLELAEALRVDKPNLKIIIHSGYSPEIVETGKPTAMGIEYLQKPCSATVLWKTIRDCLDRK